MDAASPGDAPLSPGQFLRLDAVCDQFEARWRSGERPQIEDYIGQTHGGQRSELLRELLLLELEYRRRCGERPNDVEYKRRFPEQTELIDRVFEHVSRADAQPPEAAMADRSSDRCQRLVATTREQAADQGEGWCEIVLRVIGGPHKGREFKFRGHESFVVGRAKDAHFRLPKRDPHFSRYHFLIEVNPPHCRLVDLESLNGTRVNGSRVEVADLCHGDLIRGGSTVLQVLLAGDAQPPPPPAEVARERVSKPRGRLPPPLPRHVQADAPAPRVTVDEPPDKEASPADLPEIPGYDVLRRLGHGGMGTVYLAERRPDGVLFALKTIRPAHAASERAVRQFLREARILCALRHPHIVAFHAMGHVRGQFYFAMDYVPGTDALQLLKQHGPLPVARAVNWTCQALEALGYAHRRGFVHRDVKPANLLVSESAGRETCFLADFGLARVYDDSRLSGLTMLGDVGGTLPYMPPEQIINYREVSPPADQYSTAATLYHLLAGRLPYPFTESRPQHRLLKILTEPPVPLKQCRPDVADRLAHTIHKALAKEPRRRHRDAIALREALLPFAGS